MLKKAQQFGFQLVISLKHWQLGVGSFGLDGCLPRDETFGTAPPIFQGAGEKPAVNSFHGKWPVFSNSEKTPHIRRTTQCDLGPKLKSDLFVPEKRCHFSALEFVSNMFLPSQKRTPRIGSQVTPFGVFPKKWWVSLQHFTPQNHDPFLVGKPQGCWGFSHHFRVFFPIFSHFSLVLPPNLSPVVIRGLSNHSGGVASGLETAGFQTGAESIGIPGATCTKPLPPQEIRAFLRTFF